MPKFDDKIQFKKVDKNSIQKFEEKNRYNKLDTKIRL